VTRTVKAVLSPNSALYLINPCPPARVLPMHFDFLDEHGNKYYNAFKSDKLRPWAESESMRAKTGPWKEEGDVLFFVRQTQDARGPAGFALQPSEPRSLHKSKKHGTHSTHAAHTSTSCADFNRKALSASNVFVMFQSASHPSTVRL
jgi:hypothetical protein